MSVLVVAEFPWSRQLFALRDPGYRKEWGAPRRREAIERKSITYEVADMLLQVELIELMQRRTLRSRVS